jgi:hypothetical protein
VLQTAAQEAILKRSWRWNVARGPKRCPCPNLDELPTPDCPNPSMPGSSADAARAALDGTGRSRDASEARRSCCPDSAGRPGPGYACRFSPREPERYIWGDLGASTTAGRFIRRPSPRGSVQRPRAAVRRDYSGGQQQLRVRTTTAARRACACGSWRECEDTGWTW